MQTESQILSPQSDRETRKRIETAVELIGYPAVRSMMFRIEQGVVDIRGRFPSFYLCQVAIERVKRVPGVVRVINRCEVVYALVPLRESVESNGEATSGLPSIAALPAAEDAALFCNGTTGLRSYDESARYAGVSIHD